MSVSGEKDGKSRDKKFEDYEADYLKRIVLYYYSAFGWRYCWKFRQNPGWDTIYRPPHSASFVYSDFNEKIREDGGNFDEAKYGGL